MTIHRTLGRMALSDRKPTNIDDASDLFTATELSDALEASLLRKLASDKTRSSGPLMLSAEKAEKLLRDPAGLELEFVEIGYNHLKQTPVYAYRRGNGKWTLDEAEARSSVMHRLREIIDGPAKREHKTNKSHAHDLEVQLRQINPSSLTQEEALKLSTVKESKPRQGSLSGWIADAEELLRELN